MSSLGGLAGPSVSSILSNQVSADSQGELQGIMASISGIAMIVGPLLLTQTFTYFTSDSAPVYLPGSAFWVAAILTIAAVIIFSASSSAAKSRRLKRMDIVKHNQVAWDNQSNHAESPWVKPVSRDEMAGARAGNWQVICTPPSQCLRNGLAMSEVRNY